MDGMMIQKKRNSSLSKISPAPGLGIHRTSTQLVITKVKPKIRIIHIFAPEIIKTDVANFRELVQRLTGKPSSEMRGVKRKGGGAADQFPAKRAAVVAAAETGELTKKKTEEFSSWGYRERVSKVEMEDQEMMMMGQRVNGGNGSSHGGGYLGQFSDLDGLMQELNNCDQFFPLFPATETSNSQVAPPYAAAGATN